MRTTLLIPLLFVAGVAFAEKPPCVGDRHDDTCQTATCTGDEDGFVFTFSPRCEAFLNGTFLTAVNECANTCAQTVNVTCPVCPEYAPEAPKPAPMYRPCRLTADGGVSCPAAKLPHRVLVPFNQ